MGYTQYWRQSRAFTSSEWETVKTLAEELTSYCEVPLDDLEISDNHIVFNGVEEDGHESFVLSIVPEPQPWQDEHFDFCKTARKPYDVPVALLLLAIHHFVPNVLAISSDGQWNEDTSKEDWGGGWVHIREQFEDFFDETPEKPEGIRLAT